MRILKEGSIYFGASVLERAVPFILVPFLTRLLSTEEYGLISIFMTVAAIYSLVIGVGLGGFLRVIYHKSDNLEFNMYVGNVLSIAVASLLVAIFLTALLHKNIVLVSGLESDFIPLVIVVAIAQFIINIRIVIFQAARMPLHYAKVQLSRPILDLFLVILLVFYLSGGGVERIYALVASNVVTALIACFSMYRDGLLNLKLDRLHTIRALRFVTPLLPHTIALTAVFTVDKLILSSSIGLSIVGELAVALSLASPTVIITESINRTFMPWSYGKFIKNELEQVVGASYILLIGMFFICLMYSVLLAMSFDVIVGASYQNALVPAMIMVWIGWLKLAYYLVAKGLMYCESTTHKPLIAIVAGVLYIGLLLINVEKLNLVDIAVYMIIFHVVMFIGTSILSQRKFPQPWGKLSSMKDVAKILIENLSHHKYFRRN